MPRALSRRGAISVIAAALVASPLMIPPSADAAEATAAVELVPGVLALVGVPRIVDLGRSNDAAGEMITISADVVDARGTGGGWTLVVTVSVPSLLTVLSVGSRCSVASSCTLPVIATSNTMLTAVEAGPDIADVVFRANPFSGMGSETVVVNLDEVIDHSLNARESTWSLSLLPDLATSTP